MRYMHSFSKDAGQGISNISSAQLKKQLLGWLLNNLSESFKNKTDFAIVWTSTLITVPQAKRNYMITLLKMDNHNSLLYDDCQKICLNPVPVLARPTEHLKRKPKCIYMIK